MHCRIASLIVFLALVPHQAFASLHADLGSSSLLNVLLALLASVAGMLRFAAPLMLVAAAYLFWKKNLGSWLFACAVIPVVIGQVIQLSGVFATPSTSAMNRILLFQLLNLVVYGCLLVAAIRAKPARSNDA